MPTAVGSQQFRKESRKHQGRIMFERNYSFFYHCLLSCRYVMLQNSILSKSKWWAQAVVRGGTASLAPRSDGTAPLPFRRSGTPECAGPILCQKKTTFFIIVMLSFLYMSHKIELFGGVMLLFVSGQIWGCLAGSFYNKILLSVIIFCWGPSTVKFVCH